MTEKLTPSPDLALYLADTTLAAGLHYGLWVEKAPSTEEQVALSSMSQDKLGHARALYKIAEDITDRSTVELHYDRSVEDFAWNPAWTIALPTWQHLILAQALFGDALLLEMQNLDTATPYGALLSKIEQEDIWHEQHAEAWLASAHSLGQTGKLDEALDDLWPSTVAYFGAQGQPRFPEDVEAGVLTRDDDTLRSAFLDRAVPRLREAGISVPAKQEDEAWSLSPAPDASLMEEVREATRQDAVELVSLLQDPHARDVAELA